MGHLEQANSWVGGRSDFGFRILCALEYEPGPFESEPDTEDSRHVYDVLARS